MRLAPLFVSAITLIALCGCQPSQSADQRRADAELYIRNHITELSPIPPTLGGTFYVTTIEWQDDDTAKVSYEDGHIALVGTSDLQFTQNGISASKITLDRSEQQTSSAASAPSSVSQQGAFCGGIAAIKCPLGFTCQLQGSLPDAGGVCVKL